MKEYILEKKKISLFKINNFKLNFQALIILTFIIFFILLVNELS